MMKFALITEGVTDYLVLKQILHNFFKQEDVRINQLQPTLDNTDKQKTGGGWTEVIKYCDSDKIEEILLWNDFVVIQIDTDIADDPKINLQKHNKSIEEIFEGMKNILVEKITTRNNNVQNVIFAIGVEQIECWLVGIIDNNHNYSNIENCTKRLNRAISKTKKYKVISPDKKENSKETYINLASLLKKNKEIIEYSKKNIGFEKFIKQLETIQL